MNRDLGWKFNVMSRECGQVESLTRLFRVSLEVMKSMSNQNLAVKMTVLTQWRTKVQVERSAESMLLITVVS